MTEEQIRLAAQQYVDKRFKESDNQRYFNHNSCIKDFIAGIKYVLKLQDSK